MFQLLQDLHYHRMRLFSFTYTDVITLA